MSDQAETFPLEIGKEIVNVPLLTFYDLERHREKMEAVEKETDWIKLPKIVLQIFASQLVPDGAEQGIVDEAVAGLQRKCSISQMRVMVTKYNDFLVASGFSATGEAQATTANPGTGTSTDSSQILPSGEFVEATQSPSNVH